MEVTNKILFVQKFLAKELDEHENTYFEQWLKEEKENSELYSQLKEIWSIPMPTPKKFNKDKAYQRHLEALQMEGDNTNSSLNITESAINSDEHSIINTSNSSQKQGRIVSLSRIMWAAAAIFVFVIGAWFIVGNSNNVIQTFDAVNARQVASLEDGTKVNLNQGAKLEVLENKNERKVKLTGEAFFEVVKHNGKPFIVSADEATITVLGTSFSVNTLENFCAVKEGTVEVSVDGQKVKVTGNQKVSYKNGKIEVIDNNNFDESTSWLKDDLKFANEPFDKVIEKLGKHFNVNFVLPQTRDWSSCTFTSGSLKDASIDDVLIILQLTYQLEFSKTENGDYKLTKVKCK